MNKVEKAIQTILDAGLSVIEHKNNSGKGKTNHLTIVGGDTVVEFYPTTGTVFSNKSKVNLKNSTVECAIQKAKTK